MDFRVSFGMCEIGEGVEDFVFRAALFEFFLDDVEITFGLWPRARKNQNPQNKLLEIVQWEETGHRSPYTSRTRVLRLQNGLAAIRGSRQ